MSKKTLLFTLGDYILIILIFMSFVYNSSWTDVLYFFFGGIFFSWRLFSRDAETNRWAEFIAVVVLIALLMILTGGEPFLLSPLTPATTISPAP